MRFFKPLWLMSGAVFPAATGFAAGSAQPESRFEANGISWQAISDWQTMSLFNLGGAPVTTMGLVRLVAIVLVTWWLSRLAQATITRISAFRPNFSGAALYTLNRLVNYTVLTIGFFVAIASIGIDLSKLALFASALGVGIGFGLQNIISNFVAGLVLLFEKSLKVGDFIDLPTGISGEVREISFRSTLVTTNDNVDIVVPNSEFVNGHVMNWTMREVNRRIHVPFGVAYGSDKDLVRKAVLEAAETVRHTLEDDKRKPQVWLTAFGDSSLNFELIVWLKPEAVKRPGAVKAEYLWAIETALNNYHIEIPFPQRDLHVRSWSPQARPPSSTTD